MDRQTVYPGAIPLETDLLNTNRNVLVGLSKIAAAVLGTSTLVNGLACVPTSPASLQVQVAPGEIYSLQNLDGTAYSSLAADTTHQILKQGLLMDTATLNCPAPSTSGYSINYLIEATYQDVDGNALVLPYYNASNPSQAYSGPANSGTAQNTTRKGVCTVTVKTGVAAATGTQQTPAADGGYVGLWVVTVAYGQTQITAANIALATNAPFLPSGGIVPAIQNYAFNYALDTGTANTYLASYNPPVTMLTDGMILSFRAKTANTGASTFSPNGLAAKPIYSQAHVALLSGEIAVNGFVEVEWNSALNGWVLCENSGGIAHGVTPAQFDSTQKLATTAFVQRAIGNMYGFVSYTGNKVLSASDVGRPIQIFGAGASNVTLPLASTCPPGSVITLIVSDAGATASISTQGGDVFCFGAPAPMKTGDSIQFASNGVETWWSFGGTNHAQKSSGMFGASVSANGYKKGPAGEIEQWVYAATGTSAAGSILVTLPIAFPAMFLSAVACSANGSNPATAVGIGGGCTLTQAQVFFASNTSGVFVRAIGK